MVAATFAGGHMSESAFATPGAASRLGGHGAVIPVDSDDTKIMGRAISYSNLTRAYAESNEQIRIEVVANGSAITIFRGDKSPSSVAARRSASSRARHRFQHVQFITGIAEQKEGKAITLIPGARLVPFGRTLHA